MIKLFKNIRKNMLKEGKTTNYLKYAIGEIILVVIGILIALQINNWNTNKNKQIEEHNDLVNLKQDFSYNKNQMDSLILRTDFFVNQSLEVLNYTGSKPKPLTEKEFNELLNNLATTPSYSPQNGFIDDIMNSGRLNIITNVQLRNKLSSWKPSLDYIKLRENLLTKYNMDLINLIIKRGSWLNADEVNDGFSGIVFPKSGFDVDNREILNDLQFENMVENHINFLLELKKKQNVTQKLMVEILSLINNELDK